MPHQIRMTYCYPEQLQKLDLGEGKHVMERIPNHPTRPAHPWEVNVWFEDIEPQDVAKWQAAGAGIREVGAVRN
jgi:hypothetical protein